MKKLLTLLLTGLLLTGTLLTAGCTPKDTPANTTAEVTTEATTTAPQVNLTTAETTLAPVPQALPSMAPAGLSMNGVSIDPAVYDFWYYVIMPYQPEPPVDENGNPNWDADIGNGQTYNEWMSETLFMQIQATAARSDLAREMGMTLSDEFVQTIEGFWTQFEAPVSESGISYDDYLKTMFGEFATKAKIQPILENDLLGTMFMESYEISQEELEAYYAKNESEIGLIRLPIVHHVLFEAQTNVATETEDAAAKALAEETLEKVNQGEDIATLGTELMNNGSSLESAQYTVEKGRMVPEFDSWCFDAARAEGDTDIVKTSYGYHVIKFLGFSEEDWSVVEQFHLEQFLDGVIALPKYQITVDS